MSEENLTPEQPADAGFSSPEESIDQAEKEVERKQDPTDTIETLAASMGWREMENGKSALEFVRDTADINQSLRKRVERLSDQVDKLVSTSTKQTMRALQEQKERLEREFEEAVESGDKVAAKKASDAMSRLEEPDDQQDKQAELAKIWQPHAEKFVSDNQKALTDPLARSEAEELIERMWKRGSSPEETYSAVERKLKKDFPEFYTNQNRERPPKVSGDTAPRSDKSAWSTLLKQAPEAEGAFKQFVDMGVYKDIKEDREKYAKLALED